VWKLKILVCNLRNSGKLVTAVANQSPGGPLELPVLGVVLLLSSECKSNGKRV